VASVRERPGADGVDPATVSSEPLRPPSSGSVALGRAMLGLGDVIEGKPPREAYEYVMVDENAEPEHPDDPQDLVVVI